MHERRNARGKEEKEQAVMSCKQCGYSLGASKSVAKVEVKTTVGNFKGRQKLLPLSAKISLALNFGLFANVLLIIHTYLSRPGIVLREVNFSNHVRPQLEGFPPRQRAAHESGALKKKSWWDAR